MLKQAVPMYDENEPFIFRRWMMGNIEGRLLTLIEAFGFEGRREEAVKSLVRNELWLWFRENMVAIPERELENFEKIVNSAYTNVDSINDFGKSTKLN